MPLALPHPFTKISEHDVDLIFLKCPSNISPNMVNFGKMLIIKQKGICQCNGKDICAVGNNRRDRTLKRNNGYSISIPQET